MRCEISHTRRLACLATPRRFHTIVVILRWLFLNPSDEGDDVLMGLQLRPSTVAAGKLFLGQRGMNFSVAHAMHGVRLAPALAFGNQMMLIDTFTRDKWPAAKRAVA